jgi:flagellar basal-body rod modification protein FlgD
MTTSLGLLPPGLEHLQVRSADTRQNKELGQDTFLELMIAQLKNQDPLKPTESGEFLSQIAQFSTVSGIQQLQGSFSSVAAALQSNQALQASTLVGRTVLTARDTAALEPGTAVRGAFELPAAAANVAVEVYDGAGQRLKRLELGNQRAGLVNFTWNGLDEAGAALPAGTYRFKAQAQIGEETRAIGTYLPGKVESVSLRAGAAPFLKVTHLGTVSLDAIKLVL